MITKTQTRRGTAALTSDRWHVLHARWLGDSTTVLFARSIVSEHDDHRTAVQSATTFLDSLAPQMERRAQATRDQVLIRRPSYKSLAVARRTRRGRK